MSSAADLTTMIGLRAENEGLRQRALQAERARDAERAARRNAEADVGWWHATVANYVTSATVADRELLRGVMADALTVLHPGAALLAELEASRPIVAAASAWREAVETMDGQWAAEQALIAALKARET